MKDETAPVSPDEVVVRLIWTAFFVPSASDPVRDRAFMPRLDEADGISVFRVACLNDPTDALAVIAPEKRDKYGVVVLPVAELTAIGLSIQPAKIDTIPGHAVIPELNSTAYRNDSMKCQDVQKLLAALANQGIVRVPTPPAS